MRKFLYLLPLLFGMLACGAQTQPILNATDTAGPAQPATQAGQMPALSLDLLRQAVYHSPDWGDYQLAEGVYHRPPPNSQESPETYITHLLDTVLYGDINSDGMEDAVVFLSTQNGGTGHFVEMAAVLNLNGSARNIATIYLGDRVIVESGAIQNGVITLNMRVRGPNDGACCPSQSEVWNFHMENDQLIRIP